MGPAWGLQGLAWDPRGRTIVGPAWDPHGTRVGIAGAASDLRGPAWDPRRTCVGPA